MKFLVSALLLLAVCGSAFPRETPPSIPPAYWLLMDGVPGDSTDVTARLQEVLNLCATTTGYLRLDSGVYLLTDSIVVPGGVTFEGNYANLHFEISGEAKALCLEGSTKVSGFVIDVDSTTAITGHGGHGVPICIGEYADGTGYSNIEITNLTLHSEKIDGNGLFITGNSHDIEITNIYFPNSINMGRAISIHWGNTAYDIAEDTGRTYHPHNISISNITIDTISQTYPSYAVGISLSGCYNIDVDNVNILQAGKAFHAYVGDVGYRYADPDYLDTSVIEGQGITLSGIFLNEATLNGFSVDGLSPILDTATGISDSDAVWDLPVHFSNSALGSDGFRDGILLSNCRNVVVDNCVFDGFRSGFATATNVINTKILNCTFRNGQNHGVNLSNSATPTSSPQDITVDNCFLYNNGLADSTLYAGIRVNDASRCIITNNKIGLTAGEWVKYGILVTQSGAGHIVANNHVFDVSGGDSAYSLVEGDSTLLLFWGNMAESGLIIPSPRVMYDTTRFAGIVRSEKHFKTDNPAGIAADFKSSNTTDTRVMIANTDIGDVVLFFDAINGDFAGGDYARIGQNDSGYFEFMLGPAAPNWAFHFTDGTNTYTTVSKTALTVGAYALPMTDGTADQVLTTNGSGVTSWNTQAGAGGGESNTIQDTGVYNETEGFGLSGGKAGVDLHVKGLIEGSNITITKNADSALTIAASAGGGDGLDTTEVLDILRDSISGDATVGAGGVMTVVDDLHDHVYSNIDATTSANWIGRVSDETGTGVWVFGTQPTFTTDLEVPLIIGGTATTSDLSLKTTSGVGATGADMHFLVGNNGATEAMTILNDGNVGIGTTPDVILHLKADVAHGPFIKLDRTDGTWIDDVAIIGVSGTASDVDTDFLWMGKSTGDKDFMLQFNTGNVGIGNGIGVILPPEKLSVLGNIATGDTATGEVDVYHYFSTNGSWTTEYLMWDDNPGCFVISDALDVDGNILLSGTVDGVEISNLNTDVAADSGSWNATADALGTAIDSTKTTNESMSEADLTISNAPTDEYALTWEASAGTGGQMTWEAQAGGSPSLEDIFNYMHPDIFDTTGFNDSIGIKDNGITDGMVLNTITIDESSDVDTTGTKISAALANRLDDLMSETYKFFSRRYFDTLTDEANGWFGDTIICILSDSTDLSIFDTDDLTQGASNKYDQALPDSSEWSIAYDSSQVGYLNPADPNVDTAAWNAAGGGLWDTVGTRDTGVLVGSSDTLMAIADTGTSTSIETQNAAGFMFLDPIWVDNLTVGTDITVPFNSISSDELNEGDNYMWTADHVWGGGEQTFQTTVWFDDGVGDSPALIFKDGDDKITSIRKYDAGHFAFINNEGSHNFYASNDVDDYIYFDTFTADIPMIATGGDCDLFIVPSSGELIVEGNIATGDTATGDVDVFHFFSTDGSWNSEWLGWNDGEGQFEVSDDFGVAGNITVTGTVDGVDLDAFNTDVAGDSSSWNATADALGTAIDSTKITNASVSEADLTISNSPTDEYVMTWEADAGTGGQMTWEVQAGGGVWVASNDTMFLVDADGDTLAAFWDDDAGNVCWQVATEDQTLRLLIDTLGIGTTSPDEILHLFGNNAALKLEDDSENDATINVGNSQICISIDPDNLIASSDICFDIDGNEVARFHSTTNFGIGTLSPPERLTVVGNIATGDTAAGDVDVYKYFSTDGSYTDEYFPKWDDGLGRFEISDDLYVTGTVKTNDTLTSSFVIITPAAANDFPFWQTRKAITITAVSAVCTEGTNVIGALQEYNATGTSVDAAVDGDWTITTSEYTDASFTNAGIDAGDWLGWKTTSVSGSVVTFSITFEYTVD